MRSSPAVRIAFSATPIRRCPPRPLTPTVGTTRATWPSWTADGYISITDRISDVIIRGGENISAAEVEEVLMALPGVAEVAVVAAPDPRMGEHAAAFVRMLNGAPFPTCPRYELTSTAPE